MDNPLTILLVEDEPTECAAFIQHIENIDNIRLVDVTNNADKALESTRDYLPDAIILDLELQKGGGNGIGFLTALGKANLPVFPFVLVTTNNVSNITHTKVRSLGADFIMVKSQSDYSVATVVDFLLSLKGIIHEAQRKPRSDSTETLGLPTAETKNRLSARVSTEIDKIGISPKAVGRSYLIDAIISIIGGQSGHITRIAQKHGKTDASVERAMQNAINSAWKNWDTGDLYNYYTARISSEKGVPTLTEFIFYYANKIKDEYKELVPPTPGDTT